MERTCKTCGTTTDGTEAFCRVCDTYLGWSINASDPSAVPADSEADPVAAEQPGPDAGPRPAPPPPPPPPRPDRVVAPVASVKQTEVIVTPDSPGEFAVDIKNDSTIVDSYLIDPADAPGWLLVGHDEANLLPGVLRTVAVRFSVRPGAFAAAQRVAVRLHVRSSVDPGRATPLAIDVIVPKAGPPAAIAARPHLIRLEDATEGGFGVHLDNSAANFARQYRLTGTDPEGVVRIDFVPAAVDLPAGGTAETTVRFTAPAPPPGKEISRQLTVTATDPDGTVTVPVTITQTTSAPPESLPVRLRLEPAQVAMVDSASAEINLVLDNRGGREVVKFNLSGRDPGNEVGFRFEHTRVAVQAGSLGYVRFAVQTRPPPRGETDNRPFSVVAIADGGREVEAAGVLELSSRPDSIASARLFVQPEHLVTAGRKGTFAVDVDNRRGSQPLQVQLSGTDEYGRARLTFRPAALVVPPGQVARASLVVAHPSPSGGTSASRKVLVRATSPAGAIDGEATFTQNAASHRRLWGVLLVLLGVLLVVLGAFVWASDPELGSFGSAASQLVDDAQAPRPPDPGVVVTAVIGLLLGLLLLCALLMLLGLTSSTGRMVRVAAVFAVIFAFGVLVAAPIATFAGFSVMSAGFTVGGLVLVVAGAVSAFLGGVLIRR